MEIIEGGGSGRRRIELVVRGSWFIYLRIFYRCFIGNYNWERDDFF